MREREIEGYLVRQLKGKVPDAEVRKVSWLGHTGAPDRFIACRGHSVFVELKAPGKKLSAHQAREKIKLERAGQTVLVIDSKEGVDALVAFLREGSRRATYPYTEALEAYRKTAELV